MWHHRMNWVHRPEALPKVLLAADWARVDSVICARRLLPRWAELRPEMALELLDANFADEHVRAYAVSRLELLNDNDLADYLVQLVQVLKYEPYHDVALTRFLLRRALRSRHVGHYLFWLLKSEMHSVDIQLRFGLILEAYLRGAQAHMEDLINQNNALSSLLRVAAHIKTVKGAERKEALQAGLRELTFPASFQLALNPKCAWSCARQGVAVGLATAVVDSGRAMHVRGRRRRDCPGWRPVASSWTSASTWTRRR